MKESKKLILGMLKKNVEREDKFENLVLNLALRKLKGARKDIRGVYYSKSMKRVMMATKTLEGCYTINEGTEEIEDNAFWGCAFVERINIPESVTAIGNESFGRCLSLKGLVIPRSVRKLGHNPFVDIDGDDLKCESTDFTIEQKILYTADKKRLISCLTDAAMVLIPNVVEEIGDFAFTRRRNLKKVVIPKNVKTIGTDAFSDCEALEEITIPASVTTIGPYAFAECDNLKKVNFLGEVAHLSRTAFSDCDSLRSINIPEGTTGKFTKQLRISSESEIILNEKQE